MVVASPDGIIGMLVTNPLYCQYLLGFQKFLSHDIVL
jgi:hypothetical protein